MVAPAVEGINLFKIAGRSISGWIPSLKTGTVVRQPFCSQLEERFLLLLGLMRARFVSQAIAPNPTEWAFESGNALVIKQ
jgi:hypothetical protein